MHSRTTTPTAPEVIVLSEEPFYEKRHSIFLFLVESFGLAMVDQRRSHLVEHTCYQDHPQTDFANLGTSLSFTVHHDPHIFLAALNSSITRFAMQTGIETSSSRAKKCSS
ncbi:hypothetical protein EV702DRAFT_1208310 [Suillus placidus]|uniref:Uncharacterized protein n=1 Tax=Suillus placidus TaxID=48579 RepID=A0A9P7CVF0_9AGAM|nr:hypothetical protein EV702DRAFT_1208310 [Suillus placidus]